MQEIQFASAKLAGHPDSYISNLALLIAEADLQRDLEHDNQIVEKDASISTTKAKLRVTTADNRRLRAQLNKSQDMQFGQSSEKVSNKKKDIDDDGATSVEAQPYGSMPNFGGAEAQPEAEKPKPRGMLGRQVVEIPKHLPREQQIISPPNGSVCDCGCSMALIGEQTIERLTYKPAEVRVIEES